MQKRTIIIILLVIFSVGIISLYSTFAYDPENSNLSDSTADYNLIYSIKKSSDKIIIVGANEETYVDITLQNTYSSVVRYGMYYYILDSESKTPNLSVSLSDDSVDTLQNIIKPSNTRSISLKISNHENYQISLVVGALIGFENGKIEDLVKNGEILIK